MGTVGSGCPTFFHLDVELIIERALRITVSGNPNKDLPTHSFTRAVKSSLEFATWMQGAVAEEILNTDLRAEVDTAWRYGFNTLIELFTSVISDPREPLPKHDKVISAVGYNDSEGRFTGLELGFDDPILRRASAARTPDSLIIINLAITYDAVEAKRIPVKIRPPGQLRKRAL